ncbi:sialate:O-sulfotransferase 1-like isoform X1 [Apostichopus japonicus]|uniref:sialate:O-sulfotransferase 1-like isoform X1 n=1 Tax=Stichopus japonicus TaxID=307972 RepID=UPI003AB6CC4B
MAVVRVHIVITPSLCLLLGLFIYAYVKGRVEVKLILPTSRDVARFQTAQRKQFDQSPRTVVKKVNLLEEAIVTYHGNIEEVDVDKYIDHYKPIEHDVHVCFDEERVETVTVPSSLPSISVVSYPRSGNRYTRTCLRDITRGNILAYNSAHGSFLGAKGPTIKINRHDDETILNFKEGAILLIRNPRDVITSNFFYYYCFEQDQDDHVVTEWIKTSNELWTNWIEKNIEIWKLTYLDWLNKAERLLIVFTEDVANSPIREFARMLVFLNQTVSYEEIHCKIYKSPWGKRKYLEFEPNLPQELIQPAIDVLNKALTDKGASPLPTYANTYL